MQRIMKKTIAILLSVSCLFGLDSCFKTDDEVFDKSAAQRLNELQTSYREVLSSAENGWVFQYFASEEEQGYPFVMKFDKNGGVTIAGNNSVSTSNAYKEESSTYDFVQDMSVVLTFDTYNTIFHEFSQPGDDGVGHGGDYEFQIKGVSANKDTVYVMGKKTGINMRLVKFPMGATYTSNGESKTVSSWEDYFTAIKANTATLFNSKFPNYTLSAGDESYVVSGMGSGVMTLVPSDATESDVSSRTYYRGLIVNLDNTVRLSSPFKGENDKFSVQTFGLADAKDKMVALDGTLDAVLTLPTLATLFGQLTWTMSSTTLEGQFATLYDAVAAGLVNYNKNIKLSNLGFGYDSTEGKNYLNIKSTKYTGKLYFEAVIFNDTTVTLKFTGTGDKNGAAFLKNVPALQQLINYLESDGFVLSTATPFAPLTVTMVNASNQADKAVLTL